jgi:hypothetical protein
MESTACVYLGYRCPVCGQRVRVLSSIGPATEDFLPATIDTACHCGYEREIYREEVLLLDIWRETSPLSSFP